MSIELKQAAEKALVVLGSATSFMSRKARDQHESVVAELRTAIQQATQPAEVTDEEIDYAVLQTVGFDGMGTQEMNQFDCRNIARAILALRPVQVPMTDEQREHFNAGYEAAQQDALVCRLPPNGWCCTRTAGHDGPCAAIPSGDESLVKRGMDRLRAAQDGITAQAKKEGA